MSANPTGYTLKGKEEVKKKMRKILLLAVVLALTAAPGMVQAWSDSFTYPDSPLAGNDGWTGGATIGVDVVSNELKVSGQLAKVSDVVSFGPVNDPNTIRCQVFAKPGVGLNTIWSIDFQDAGGASFARWYGSGTTARPRINGYGLVLAPVTLVAGMYNQLDVFVNQTAGTSTFYHNGAYLGFLQYSPTSPATGGVGRVEIHNEARAAGDGVGEFLNLDDASVIPEPSSLVALSMFGLGALGFIRRRS